MSIIVPWLRIAVPLAVLNALLTLGAPAAAFWPQFTARVSLELCVGVVLLAGWTAWRGSASGRATHWLAAASAALIAVHLLDLTATALFGRPLNLYWDGRHLGSVLAQHAVPAWQVAVACGLLLLAVAALAWLAWACWRTLGRGLAWRPARLALLALCGVLMMGRAVDGLGGQETWRAFSDPVTRVVLRQAQFMVAQSRANGSASRLSPSPAFAADVGALKGADVLVLFSESYGVCTLDDPAQARALAGPRDALAQAIAASGRAVVSARVRSPTFGGGSWLAHGALLTGVDTRDPLDYDLLLTTRRPTLVQHFAAHGYQTVSWMPGLQRPWPEGRFFGFDRYVDANTMGYTGLPFGAWRIPDQAAMALLQAQELAAPAAARKPRFIVFPTLNSHAPFHPLPPFVADWTRLTGPAAYTPAQQMHAMEELTSWQDPVPAYVQSIALTWQWLGAYLREQAPRQLVVILIGDHQPWARVSGSGHSWDVPVHIIGADPALLRRFEREGFQPGLMPGPDTLGAMQDLAPLLSKVFARP